MHGTKWRKQVFSIHMYAHFIHIQNCSSDIILRAFLLSPLHKITIRLLTDFMLNFNTRINFENWNLKCNERWESFMVSEIPSNFQMKADFATQLVHIY